MDVYFSDDYGWTLRGPYAAYHYESERVRKLMLLHPNKHPLVAFHEDSQRRLEGTCGCGDPHSDGSEGDLIADQDGELTLGGVPLTDLEYSVASGTIGTAFDATTTIDNVDNFVIPDGVNVNVVGKFIIYAKNITIDGTLDGTGGGYPGGAATDVDNYSYAEFGSSPAGSYGEGGGGIPNSYGNSGGGGAGHGVYSISLFHVMLLKIFALTKC